MKFTEVIKIYKSMFPVKSDIKKYKYFVYWPTQKFDTLRRTGNFFLKRILIHCTKYNEINMRYSDVQKHFFYIQGHTKVFGYIMAYVWKRLEMYFQCVSWFVSIIQNSNELCERHIRFKNIIYCYSKVIGYLASY